MEHSNDIKEQAEYLQSLLTTKELATLLGRPLRSVQSMRYRGQLPEPLVIKGLKGLRWDPETIRTHLARQIGRKA